MDQQQSEAAALEKRPTLSVGKPGPASMRDSIAYILIRDAVKTTDGLAWGSMFAKGNYCAIRRGIQPTPRHPDISIPGKCVSATAAYNDSIPEGVDPETRKDLVLGWLQGKIKHACTQEIGEAAAAPPRKSMLGRIVDAIKG